LQLVTRPSGVDTRAFALAAKSLKRFPGRADATLEATLDEIGTIVQTNVRAKARRHRQTGRLERYVKLKATGKGAKRVVRVHAAGRVAHLITGGTRPHLIPKLNGPDRILAFVSGAGLTQTFAAEVRHPGTRADPFVAAGIDASRPAIRALARTKTRKLATDLARDMRS
jgi:hypothetical protein